MNKPENTSEQIENVVVERDEVEEQVDLKVKRVKALKTGIKGGLQSRISGNGRGIEFE